MEITWYEEDDVKAAVAEYTTRDDAQDLDGAADAELFFKALAGAVLMSKESDDDKKKEFTKIFQQMSKNIPLWLILSKSVTLI